MSVRVRFAPSPTGYLHIGGARTALFNYLYARKNAGTFILRIEDTDVERSSQEMVEGIVDGLGWLGLDWDEGPLFQSQRAPLYRQVMDRLADQGSAYPCFCTAEELEGRRGTAGEGPSAWAYDKKCRDLTVQEVARRRDRGDACVWRMKVPQGWKVRFKDRVFGKVEVDSANIEDFVLMRNDGMPTYHLSVVADDIDLGITDVIRGVDHLSNTPKHVLIYAALKVRPPKYAHLPLILGGDKKRLSKRHGATSVLEYRRLGYLPAAMRNYLALLGWSPSGNQEIYSDRELIEAFDLGRVNKADAVLDQNKLDWLNGKYISAASTEDLIGPVSDALRGAGLWRPEWDSSEREWFAGMIGLLKPRMRRISDFADLGRPYFSDEFAYRPEAVDKYLKTDAAVLRQALVDLQGRYEEAQPFGLEQTEGALRDVAEGYNLKAGALIGAVRVALTGQSVAPSLFEVIVRLGRAPVLRRLRRLINDLR